MSERSPFDSPPRVVLDFSQPMRLKPRARMKIIPAAEAVPGDASPVRMKLYESMAQRAADE